MCSVEKRYTQCCFLLLCIFQSGKISANVFSCSFNESVAVRYEVEKMCLEEFFTCPLCTPHMPAVSVDGNRKHNTARYFFYSIDLFFEYIKKYNIIQKYTVSFECFIQQHREKGTIWSTFYTFMQSDLEVSGFVDFIHKNNKHFSIIIMFTDFTWYFLGNFLLLNNTHYLHCLFLKSHYLVKHIQ